MNLKVKRLVRFLKDARLYGFVRRAYNPEFNGNSGWTFGMYLDYYTVRTSYDDVICYLCSWDDAEDIIANGCTLLASLACFLHLVDEGQAPLNANEFWYYFDHNNGFRINRHDFFKDAEGS